MNRYLVLACLATCLLANANVDSNPSVSGSKLGDEGGLCTDPVSNQDGVIDANGNCVPCYGEIVHDTDHVDPPSIEYPGLDSKPIEPECGENEISNGGTCFCKPGFVLKGDSCVSTFTPHEEGTPCDIPDSTLSGIYDDKGVCVPCDGERVPVEDNEFPTIEYPTTGPASNPGVAECGINKVYNGSACVCKSGFEIQGDICLVPTPIQHEEGTPCDIPNSTLSGIYDDKGVCVPCDGERVPVEDPEPPTLDKPIYTTNPECPVNSSFNGKNCVCNSGFELANEACVLIPQSTMKECGLNQVFNGSECECEPEFVLNSNNECVCLSELPCQEFATRVGSDCECIEGYQLEGSVCAKVNAPTVPSVSSNPHCAENSSLVNGKCVCDEGFIKNEDGVCVCESETEPANPCQPGFEYKSSENRCVSSEIIQTGSNVPSTPSSGSDTRVPNPDRNTNNETNTSIPKPVCNGSDQLYLDGCHCPGNNTYLPTCPSGYKYDRFECKLGNVTYGHNQCESGKFNSNGVCIVETTMVSTEPEFACPPNKIQDMNTLTCVCPQGQIPNGEDCFIQTMTHNPTPSPKPVCLNGQNPIRDNCSPQTPPQCDDGTWDESIQDCVCNESPSTSIPGVTPISHESNPVSPISVSMTVCEEGEVWDKESNGCVCIEPPTINVPDVKTPTRESTPVSQSCPPGYKFNIFTGCILITFESNNSPKNPVSKVSEPKVYSVCEEGEVWDHGSESCICLEPIEPVSSVSLPFVTTTPSQEPSKSDQLEIDYPTSSGNVPVLPKPKEYIYHNPGNSRSPIHPSNTVTFSSKPEPSIHHSTSTGPHYQIPTNLVQVDEPRPSSTQAITFATPTSNVAHSSSGYYYSHHTEYGFEPSPIIKNVPVIETPAGPSRPQLPPSRSYTFKTKVFNNEPARPISNQSFGNSENPIIGTESITGTHIVDKPEVPVQAIAPSINFITKPTSPGQAHQIDMYKPTVSFQDSGRPQITQLPVISDNKPVTPSTGSNPMHNDGNQSIEFVSNPDAAPIQFPAVHRTSHVSQPKELYKPVTISGNKPSSPLVQNFPQNKVINPFPAPKSPIYTCRPDQILVNNNVCVSTVNQQRFEATLICPSNYILLADNMCHFISNVVKDPSPVCNINEKPVGHYCVSTVTNHYVEAELFCELPYKLIGKVCHLIPTCPNNLIPSGSQNPTYNGTPSGYIGLQSTPFGSDPECPEGTVDLSSKPQSYFPEDNEQCDPAYDEVEYVAQPAVIFPKQGEACPEGYYEEGSDSNLLGSNITETSNLNSIPDLKHDSSSTDSNPLKKVENIESESPEFVSSNASKLSASISVLAIVVAILI